MRFGAVIYWCKRLKEPTDLQEFEAPEAITLRPQHFSVQPASGYSSIQEFGVNISQYQRVICQPYQLWENKFSIGDVFYIDGVEPSEDEQYYGERANYVVDAIAYQNVGIRLTLKRI